MVTNPSRGSLTRRSRVSATISRMRSASLRARALSAMTSSSVSGEPVRPAPVVGNPADAAGVQGFGLLSLVGVVPDPLPGRQEVDLGAAGDQLFAGVEHLTTVPGVGGDYTHADLGAAVQVEVAGLGGAHGVRPAELGDDRPDDGALLLEGVHVAQQQVQAQGPDEHQTSLSPR